MTTQSDLIVVRVSSQQQTFLAPASQLFEEQGENYRGFGQWKASSYHPAPLQQLQPIQNDLRLWLQWPNQSFHFCDLTQDKITHDPFFIVPLASQQQILEFHPNTLQFKSLPPHITNTQQQLEQALFRE